MKQGEKFPFDHFVYCNIGNPQAVGQKPVSFPRQVISCILYGYKNYSKMNMNMTNDMKSDIVTRAENTVLSLDSNINKYTDKRGNHEIRKNVADFINNRDGLDNVTADDILLSNGASSSIKLALESLIFEKGDAVMVPVPQYPLYSATLALKGAVLVPYYLKEEKEWGIDVSI
jgi:aspartate/methionine/tyrosine aminotransferase